MRQLEALFNRLLPVRQKHKGRLLFWASPCKGQEGTHSMRTSLTQGLRFGQVASSPFQGRVKGNSGSASKRTRTKTAAQKRSLQCFTYRKQQSLLQFGKRVIPTLSDAHTPLPTAPGCTDSFLAQTRVGKDQSCSPRNQLCLAVSEQRYSYWDFLSLSTYTYLGWELGGRQKSVFGFCVFLYSNFFLLYF